MAGGRRPTSYVAGVRHNPGSERAKPVTTPPHHTLPPQLHTGATASLPPWIPSIWQPPPENQSSPTSTPPQPLTPLPLALSLPPVVSSAQLSLRPTAVTQPTPPPPPPPPPPSHAYSDSAAALASALDSAVTSAVARALGAVPLPANPPSPQALVASATSSDVGLEDDALPPSALLPAAREALPTRDRERSLHDQVAVLQAALSAKNDDLRFLKEKVVHLESRISAQDDINASLERALSQLTARMDTMQSAASQRDVTVDARLNAMHDALRATQDGAAKLRAGMRAAEVEAAGAASAALSTAQDFRKLMDVFATESATGRKRCDAVEADVRALGARVERLSSALGDTTAEAVAHDLRDVRGELAAVGEAMATLRSKARRAEAQIGDVSQQLKDTLALNGAFEESIRGSLAENGTTVAAVQATVDGLRREREEKDTGATRQRGQCGELGRRTDALEMNVKSLKKLIESNLRTQWSAESIVKEQVSLITKHVCMAMRQYTARRISENNALIDQALRARIPDYAKNHEQFVLVREEDADGNETVDIQKAADVAVASPPRVDVADCKQ